MSAHSALLRVATVASALWLVAPAPLFATELWRSGERVVHFTGSLRELLSATQGVDPQRFEAEAQNCTTPTAFVDCPAFEQIGERDAWQTLTRLRFQFDLTWSDRLRAGLVYDNEWRGGVPAELFATPGALPDTFLGLEAQVGSQSNRHAWVHRVYRGWLRYEGERLQVTAGRQRIPWGVARLWNPVDRFNAIGPLAVEGDHSPGIDAIELRFLLSDKASLHALYAPATRSADARTALRYQALWRDLDIAALAGVFERAVGVGAELAGNLGDAAFRIEAIYTRSPRKLRRFGEATARSLDPFVQLAVSVDNNFELGSGLYVLVEHLYNGNALGFGAGRAGSALPFFAGPVSAQASRGEPVSPQRFGSSRVIGQARHTTGIELGYEPLPTLHAGLLLLWDWNGGSAVLAPSLGFSGLNAAEIHLGLQYFAGGPASQYGGPGGPSTLFYALFEFFF